MKINIEKLALAYGNTTALKNITLKLSEPKIHGLLGRNGAGKTSLLSLIGSFQKKTSGRLTINGEDPFENPKIMRNVQFSYDKDYKNESGKVKDMIASTKMYRPNFDEALAYRLIELFNLPQNKEVK